MKIATKKSKIFFIFSLFPKNKKIISFFFLPFFSSSQSAWRFFLCACLHRKQRMITIISSEGWLMH
jgi:hypothetical protein